VVDTGGNRFISMRGDRLLRQQCRGECRSQGWEGVRRGCRAVIANAASQVRPSPAWLGRVLKRVGNRSTARGRCRRGHRPMPFRNTPPPAHSRKRVGAPLDLGVRALNTFLTCLPRPAARHLRRFRRRQIGAAVDLARNVDADIR